MEKKRLTCIVCPIGCQMEADTEGDRVLTISGNTCARGAAYAKEELIAPKRMVTSTVRAVCGGESHMVPVKTSRPIPKQMIFPAMAEIRRIHLTTPPKPGDILIKNLLGTESDIVATGE